MTKVVMKKLYCEKCDKLYNVPYYYSYNSFMLAQDNENVDKLDNNKLFNNYCPVCKCELKEKK